jgi:hypothetical protein
MPITALLVQRQIEIPQQSCHDETHLMIRQIPPNAISGSETERLVDVSTVVIKW